MRIIWMAGLWAAGLAGGATAQAVDVTGGELRFGYERMAGEEGGDTPSKTSLEGAMSFGFGDRFGAQADLGRLWTLSTLVARTKLRKVRARIDLCVPAASEISGAAPVSTGAALAPYVTVIADPV